MQEAFQTHENFKLTDCTGAGHPCWKILLGSDSNLPWKTSLTNLMQSALKIQIMLRRF
jgi:hypothetical protein